MKARPYMILLGLFVSVLLHAQEARVFTLDYCQQQAVLNYPIYRQYELLRQTTDLQQKNLGKNWLPSMNLSGQASYQSDVTKVPVIIPQFSPETIAKDWYKLYLDVNQVVWDGGATRKGKELEEIDHRVDIRNLEIELYNLKEQVNNLFFSSLLLQENRNLLMIHAGEISSQLGELESAIRHGVVLASNADVLRAELLKVEQKIDEVDIANAAARRSLSILIGEEIPAVALLDMPALDVDAGQDASARLEFGLFDLQQNRAESLKKLSGTSLLPRFQAFGQAGLGRPAFDMLSNEFADYYIVGLRMNWNFWNWNKTRNEKSILDLNRRIIDTRRETFGKNVSVDMENKRSEILRYEQIIIKDRQILELRSKVVKEYASRLKNGTITATEYLSELNAESEAKLNINIHKIQLVQSKYKYLATIGQL